MCRCQSLFESIYWHCYAKWKFDEDIATYEDETTEKKDSRQMDNLAFWDSVSMIASRSAIITQPSPTKISLNHPTDLFIINRQPPEAQLIQNKVNSNLNLTDEEKYIKITDGNENIQKNKYRKKSTIEEIIEKKSVSPNLQRQRKKSLKERRNSRADLTLDLSVKLDNDFHEIPIIRQDSVPKFYLSYTPEYNPFVESNVLASPMIPSTPHFDLKSVVQIENEIELAIQTKKTSSRMANIRRKMIPILIKKGSTKSLPDSINHI